MGQTCSSNNNQLGPDQTGVPHFKIVVIGPPTAGKTSFIRRYLQNQFTSEYVPTERAQIVKSTKGINLPSYGLVSITLWDCPGEEDVDLRGTYYRDADAAIVVCDLSLKDSLEAAPKWKEDFFRIGTQTIHHYLRVEGVWVDSPESQPISEIVPVILVGTKYDLVWDGENKEFLKALDKFAESHHFKAGIPVTSRWNDGSVLQSLQTLVRLLMERRQRGDHDADDVKVEAALAGTGDSEVGLSSKAGPPDYGLFVHTNYKKMDEMFARANPCYARLLEWQYHFTLAARKLRQYCGQAELMEEMEEDSWDNMLVALRNEAIRLFKDVKLSEEEMTGHLQLEGLDMSDTEIPPAFDRDMDEEEEEEEEEKEVVAEEDLEKAAEPKAGPSSEGKEEVKPGNSKEGKDGKKTPNSNGKEEEKARSSKEGKTEEKAEPELTLKQKVFVILTHFNMKVSPVLHIITKDAPLLIDFVRALDAKILVAAGEAPDTVPVCVVEANRVRLTQLEFQIRELLQMVQGFEHKLRMIFA